MALWSLTKLAPLARRARETSPAQLERVIRSVKRYGVVAPVLVDDAGAIINGHIVVEAAKALGMTMIPVVYVFHLDAAEVRGMAGAQPPGRDRRVGFAGIVVGGRGARRAWLRSVRHRLHAPRTGHPRAGGR
ncbi:ParB N-terminal domain-containing protein [Sphingomonas sp. MMS24-JH45]